MKKTNKRGEMFRLSLVLILLALLSFWITGCTSGDDDGTSSDGTIKGIITDSVTGMALEGATVTVSGQSTKTLNDGHFILTGISSGSYNITVDKSGYTEYSSTITVTGGQTVFDDIKMTASASSGTVKGIITDASSGKALESTKVTIDAYDSWSHTDGHYQLTGISAGSKTLIASKSGYSTYSTTITVTSGQTTFHDIQMTAQPTTGNINGVVTEANTEKYLEGVKVSTGSIDTTSGADGKYQLTGVSSGTQTLSASKTGYDSYSTTVTVTTGETITQNIEMTAQSSTGTVMGTVSDQSSGNVIEGAIVSIGTAKTKSGSLGDFKLTGVSSGSQEITAQKSGYTNYRGSVNVTEGQNTIHNIEMTPEVTTGAVSGTVTDSKSGDELEGVKVTIESASIKTGSDGYYNLTGISAGTKTITAQRSGYENYSGSVTVTAGWNTNKDIAMTPKDTTHGTVYGTVTEGDGPSAGVTVWIGDIKSTTGSDGKYTLKGVLQGTQEVHSYKPFYICPTTKVTVKANESVEHNLVVIKEPF